MPEGGTRNFPTASTDRESRMRRAQRAERILGLVLWLGLAATLLLFAKR